MRWFVLFLVLLTPVWAKLVRHPAGFRFEVPTGWNVENGPNAAVLLPPGVKVDAGREDNPEVYTVYGAQEEDVVDALKENLAGSGVQLETAAAEPLRAPNKVGTAQTIDFVHPEKKTNIRVRIFAMTVKGKQITLVAMGLRERVAAREKELRAIALSLDYEK